ncbi:MAG: adenylate/guanylate cyclase domain-containing protein [Anaerolineae bacterium]
MKTPWGIVLRYVDLATLPDDSEEMRLKKRILALAALATPFLLGTVGLIYLAFNEPLAGALYVGYSLFIWLNLVLFLFVHRRAHLLVWIISLAVLPAHLLIALSLGTPFNSGAIVLWGLAFPVATGLVFLPFRQVMFLFAIFLFNVLVSTLMVPSLRTTVNVPMPFLQLILILNVLGISTFIVVIFAYFIWQRNAAFQLLHGEQVKSENLLLNILPSDIAAILKNENRVIADHYDGASILFADVVGFTPMSATMTPVELVNLLNEVFTYFDSLVEKYQLEKIKTIGDCYMVASGVPRPRHDHAQALVRMALEMQNFVKDNAFYGKQLSFRIGINSGPVVAGVIGRKKFIYDLWGDAVNTASRMESHGSGGMVQITQDTYELIKDEFECEARGVSYIKGKGDMALWFVAREKQ